MDLPRPEIRFRIPWPLLMICWYFDVGLLPKRRHASFLAADSKRVVDSMAQVGKILSVG